MKKRPTPTLPKGEGEREVSPPFLLGRGQGGGVVFFGTDEFAVIILEELKTVGFLPSLIVTVPDRPRGKKLILTPPPVKIWAQENNVALIQPANLKTPGVLDAEHLVSEGDRPDLFLVASYGKIIPKNILDLPEHGTLNAHPSLLPKYRGPAPIQAAILNGDTETGVTIMLLDEEVDHGPILKIQSVKREAQNNFLELRDELARVVGKLLAETIPDWLAGKIKPAEQDHARATFTKIIKKEDGLINFADIATKPLETYRKFLAYQPWPGIYFFDQKNKRVKITNLILTSNKLEIKKVIPENSREMTWEDYRRGLTPQ